MSGIRGNFGGLRSLIGKVRAAASGALTRQESGIMKAAEYAVRETIAESFLYQRTPDGEAWKPRITVYGDYRDSNPLLFDLLSYMSYEISDGKVKVTNKKPYAFYHLKPYKRRPARVFLPSSTAPGNLADKLKLGVNRAVRSFFKL
jgi:hypothetical protein